jgi:hypothetical protein
VMLVFGIMFFFLMMECYVGIGIFCVDFGGDLVFY